MHGKKSKTIDNMKVKIKLLTDEAIMPRKATPGSAAYDVYLPTDMIVQPGRSILPLEFALELSYGYEAKIESRSGFSSKGMEDYRKERKDADVLQGKIDSDYRKCVGVIVNSHESYPFRLAKGTRIAQMTIYKIEDVEFEESDVLSETERTGGFGSTGSGI